MAKSLQRASTLVIRGYERYVLWPYFKRSGEACCGQELRAMDEFSAGHFCSDEVLKYITDRSCPLRCLRLAFLTRVTDNGIIEVVKKLPLLEEVDLSHCLFSKEVLETICQFCPSLKSFKLNNDGLFARACKKNDEEALAIAENMPELRCLQLFRNELTDDGLRAILDGCPHLNCLDLRQCFNVNLEGDMRNRCTDRIKSLRLPDDPVVENDYLVHIISRDGSLKKIHMISPKLIN